MFCLVKLLLKRGDQYEVRFLKSFFRKGYLGMLSFASADYIVFALLSAMRILLVEDDVCLAETLAEALTDQRYVVDVVTDGETGWNQAKVLDYDLMLLDVMLPELDGVTLCQRLRSHGYRMPVLLLTACDTITDKITGLDAGADDYVVKPVDLQELFARIRALLRRGNCSSPPILEWGSLCLDPSTYEVHYEHKPLHVTPKEYGPEHKWHSQCHSLPTLEVEEWWHPVPAS